MLSKKWPNLYFSSTLNLHETIYSILKGVGCVWTRRLWETGSGRRKIFAENRKVTETKAFIPRCQGKLPMSHSISFGEWESKAVSLDSSGKVMQRKDHLEFRNQNLEWFKVFAIWTCTLLPPIQVTKRKIPHCPRNSEITYSNRQISAHSDWIPHDLATNFGIHLKVNRKFHSILFF
jgi:hypothetical protein